MIYLNRFTVNKFIESAKEKWWSILNEFKLGGVTTLLGKEFQAMKIRLPNVA